MPSSAFPLLAEALRPRVFPRLAAVLERFAEEGNRLWVYECPYCGGKAYNGIPGSGTLFRGGAQCSQCGKSFSAIRREPISKDGPLLRFAEKKPAHKPAGSPDGGEFASGGGGEAKEKAGKKETRPAAKTKGKSEPAAHPGAVHGSGVSVKPTEKRAFTGEPVKTTTTLTKQETGRVGEAVCLSYLKSVMGAEDARPMNTETANFPIDLIEDHAPTEIKAGLVSVADKKNHHWRLTFSKESKEEKELYESMTEDERAAWNAEKQQRILERKEAVIKNLEKATGAPVHPRTMTAIINPDTKTADIYLFDGFHDRIGWHSDMAQKGYRGSVTYS